MSDSDFSHYVADVDSDLAERLGHFMVAWGRLEHEIDGLVPIIFRLDPTLSLCITANLGTKAKIDMLRSAVNMINSILPEDLVKELNELFVLTSDLSSQKRNLIAHGRPMVFREEDGSLYWEWARTIARKKLSLTFEGTDADYWRVATGSIYILIEGYRDCARQAHKAIANISAGDWEAACIVWGRDH